MEDWELDYEWLRTQHWVKDKMGHPSLPDLNGILFLIGIQELGRWRTNFTKEEKQDLMHIAVCRLLSFDGYYAFQGRDADGWPHYELKKPVPSQGVEAQERLLKQKAIQYFKELEEE
ncbi:MAG TPA: hypothetical protein PKA00_17555 [Saprospiraceae bacterium]|mgnify:CR=1 FL=1|nr:hypothetical protein [Saprospiraceae bacterium]HMQ84728.1 hypothetical protein [Saprospiraceae bacterium]